eukprot:CAMPEP_0178980524 /NCGR_PEP_ID=MMETSP0789-20121207/26547_1 /TAXON_ID=3005 /ORGANISM="Rhizosolenia setigera, Strain CCMP 1694" /LENGTH=444 /DNA_ID=CAMNT_0020670953 /DNA_START=311 /DNA_END=1645 /DNA_ORIENTATION=+
MSLACVTLAALAAGLTMGLLSIDPLELVIKQRASSSEVEKKQASLLLPIVKDHHRLLVTLLLLNSIANEALPLFLDELVPGYVAIILSVTLLLFFGEIIPSAVFTGPKQLEIASKMAPLVQLFIFILTPLAYPIAKVLDKLLHGHDGDEEDEVKYDRNELAVLVRIMWEERMAEKRRRKHKRAILNNQTTKKNINAVNQSIRKSTKSLMYQLSDTTNQALRRSQSIELDEVVIVEGALKMKLKTVEDVYTKWKNVNCVPKDTVLDTSSVNDLYSSGHSRIPVYDNNDTKAIIGVLNMRQLVLVNPESRSKLSSLKLNSPFCVPLHMNLIDALNLLQQGMSNRSSSRLRGGHLALVCAGDVEMARKALEDNKPVPQEAIVVGIVTLEDVIEDIIQEEIYDEFDFGTGGLASGTGNGNSNNITEKTPLMNVHEEEEDSVETFGSVC